LRSLVKEAFARVENQVRSVARNKTIPSDGANDFAVVRSSTAIVSSARNTIGIFSTVQSDLSARFRIHMLLG
jgi:hypothetical protein